MAIYLWWFLLAFVPCLMVAMIWVDLHHRREWGLWPWKTPLWRIKEDEDYSKALQRWNEDGWELQYGLSNESDWEEIEKEHLKRKPVKGCIKEIL